MAKKKRCPTGSHKSKTGKSCVRNKRGRIQNSCPTLKTIGRKWKSMKPEQQNRINKGRHKSKWNAFVSKERKNCK